jgi:hypothetical protein
MVVVIVFIALSIPNWIIRKSSITCYFLKSKLNSMLTDRRPLISAVLTHDFEFYGIVASMSMNLSELFLRDYPNFDGK